MIGTDFEVRVWETLLKIPMGRAVSYSDIATKIKSPKASRAVGAAIGKNPISFVVPCHRALGKGGETDRLSLGHHPQAGDARLGSRPGRDALAAVRAGKIARKRQAAQRIAMAGIPKSRSSSHIPESPRVAIDDRKLIAHNALCRQRRVDLCKNVVR